MPKKYTDDGLIVAGDADVLKISLEVAVAGEIPDSQHLANITLKDEELGRYLTANQKYIANNFNPAMANGFITGGISTYSILGEAASPRCLPRVVRDIFDEFHKETEVIEAKGPKYFRKLIELENPSLWEFIQSSSDTIGLFFGLDVGAAYDSGAICIYRLLRLAAKNNQRVS